MICKKLFSIVIVYVLLLKLNNGVFLKSHLDAISKTLWAQCPILLSRVIENIFCKWFLSILGHDWWDQKRYYLKCCQKWTTIGFYIWCQFGCGILKMVGPKMQVFCPRMNMLKGFFLKQSCNELWYVKKCRNCTFKVNFLCQKSMEVLQKMVS